MNALILLPLTTLFLCFIVFYRDEKNVFDTKNSLRMSFLLSLVVMGAQVLISTEILSLFNAINFYAILIWWIASFCCLLGIILKNNRNNKSQSISLNYHFINWTKIDKLLLSILLLSLIFLLINAIFTAPNNWDGLTYHMPRVMHWIQNKNLDYYATNIERQISFQAFAEYIILHTFLLTDNDYFANSVQWLSMLGSLVAVSKIAAYLGSSIRGQLLTVFLLFSTPIALYEAVSIQNDMVAAFWVISSFLFLLKFKENFSWKWAIVIGASMAMALLTKSTSYIYLTPLVFYFIFLLVQHRSLKILYAGITISTLILVLNMGYYVRNVQLYKMPLPLASEASSSVSNQAYSLEAITGNTVKFFTYNFGIPIDGANNTMDNFARGTHRLLEMDIDYKATNFSPFAMPSRVEFYSQDYASNPIQMLLLLVLIPLLYLFRERFNKDFFLIFFMGVIGVFLIIFLLKWQPFGTRFQIPFWGIVAICVATVVDKLINERILPLFMLLLCLEGSYYFYHSQNLAFRGEKKIFNTSRSEIDAKLRGETSRIYIKLVEDIEKCKCREFGLTIALDDWEYYLWTLLNQKNIKVTIKSIYADNITGKLIDKNFKPCGTISINQSSQVAELKLLNKQ